MEATHQVSRPVSPLEPEPMAPIARVPVKDETAAGIEMRPSPQHSPKLGTPESKPPLYSEHVEAAPAAAKKQETRKSFNRYFFGPRDMNRHSKIPFFFRVHGSIIPHLILPLIVVTLWSAIVVAILERWFLWEPDTKPRKPSKHQFAPVMLTIMGFLVGLALSFRNSTAYERYNDGRKYWAQLTLTCENLARVIWINARERPGFEKEDLMAKITGLNLIVAFALALKHRLRFEPYMDYDDMRGYVEFLDTYARDANVGVDSTPPHPGKLQRTGEVLGLTMARSNPRRMIKQAKKPLGNLPLEILTYLQGYIDSIIDNGTLKTPIFQMQSMNSLTTLNDVLCGTDRILNTPLPIAYSITIAQISWIYILLLPFQVIRSLRWNTVPATMVAAYIILGFGLIGREIENPFGHEVNDLPLEQYCEDIANSVDLIMSRPAPRPQDFVRQARNMPLFPLSNAGHDDWMDRPIEDIRAALRTKVVAQRSLKQEI